MQRSLTLGGISWGRTLSFLFGLGMVFGSILTIRHFFAANYPSSIWAGSFCDINAFFNCDSSAYSSISAIVGVPLGYFGMMVGGLVALGALFPTADLERTNKTISLFNAAGVVALLLYSVLYLKSLCLLCTLYYVFALLTFALYARYGIDSDEPSFTARYFHISPKLLVTFGALTLLGAVGFAEYHATKREAQSGGIAARVVEEYFSLPAVPAPSVISPFMTVQSSERFDDAPIRIVEYADFLCSDCYYLYQQLKPLKEEFAGKINIAFQFFPLEAKCNSVVAKDKHPGACDLSYVAAYDASKFEQIHDEIFENFEVAKHDPEWRAELTRRYGAEAAPTDSATVELVHRIMNTGSEYEKTSDQYAHGIRSTPTMIINDRMVIGTFPYEQLRAIFQALLDEAEGGERKFMENWVESGV
jgi:uncharacterized membrane protein